MPSKPLPLKSKSLSKRKVKPQDRRYFPRWEAENRIVCKVVKSNQSQECRCVDMSCAGACVITREDIVKDQKVKLAIYLAENVPVEVEGRVLWNKPSFYGKLAGIMFENTSQKMQDLILKHAFEIKKEDLNKYWFEGWE